MPNTSLTATVVIGRFQPFHKGHLSLIRTAMEHAPKTFVLLGSDNQTRTLKNVWTTEERIQMMTPCFTEAELEQITFLPLRDFNDDKLWLQHIYDQLSAHLPSLKKLGLVGYVKDESSYYLRLFKKWAFIPAPKFLDGLSSTDLRQAYFDGLPPNPTYLPDPVIEFLCDFRKTPDYEKLRELFYEQTPYLTQVKHA